MRRGLIPLVRTWSRAIAWAVVFALPLAGTRAAAFNVQVSHDAYLAHSEPAAAGENGDLIAASKMFTDIRRYRFTIGSYVSQDDGQTWHDNGPLPGFASYQRVSDVSLAFGPDGRTAYAAVLATGRHDRPSGVFVLRSDDGGRMWRQPAPVFLDRTGATFNDKPWIAVDRSSGPRRGAVYVAWNLDEGSRWKRHRRPTGIAVATSTDSGLTFSRPHIVDRFTQRHFSIGATPAVGPDGALHVVFLASDDMPHRERTRIEMVTSRDGGDSFVRRTIVRSLVPLPGHLPHGTFRNLSLPAFAVSSRSGTMLVAWADYRTKTAAIMKVTSLGGGVWSVPARLDHAPATDGHDEFQPALAVSPAGVFGCSWFDRRYDPGNQLIDEVFAASIDDGHTFRAPVRVTATSWNPAIDAPEPEGKRRNTFIGDYQGLTMEDSAAHPVWNDTQNGRTQEIRTATVPLPGT